MSDLRNPESADLTIIAFFGAICLGLPLLAAVVFVSQHLAVTWR